MAARSIQGCVTLEYMIHSIQLSQGKHCIVDESDYDRLYQLGAWQYHKSSTGRTGYAITYLPLLNWRDLNLRKGQFRVFMHDLILFPPTGLEVDHKDGDGLNNTRLNLRLCTRQEQCFNRGTQSNSTGYKGVSSKHYKGCGERFHAHIAINGKQVHLGTFDTKEYAALVYNSYAAETFGEHARLNVLPPEYPPTLPLDEISSILSDIRGGKKA